MRFQALSVAEVLERMKKGVILAAYLSAKDTKI